MIRSCRRGAGGLVLGLAVLAGLAATSGCERAPATAPSEPAPVAAHESAPLDTEAVERLRALPYADFVSGEADGAADGVTVLDRQRMWPGLTLYSIQWLSAAELIDEQGTVLHRWQHPRRGRWDNVELLADGDLLVTGAEMSAPDAPDIRYYTSRMSWSGALRWQHYYNAHHDIEQTPSGALLVLTFERRIVPEVHPSVPLRDDNLTLLDQDGRIVESFSIYEALRKRPDIFPIHPGRPNVYAGRPWVNLLHTNSVEWMRHAQLVPRGALYGLDNVLVCFRHQNRVAVIHWPTREVVWAWGEGELDGPHDAQTLESGHMLIFDNGLKRGWSRVIELDPLSGRIVWEYRAAEPRDFYTPTKGSNQRLPNGNTLIANSDSGQIFEVTPAGEIVWEYFCPHRNDKGERATIVRAKRYSRKMIEAAVQRAGGVPTSEPS